MCKSCLENSTLFTIVERTNDDRGQVGDKTSATNSRDQSCVPSVKVLAIA